jgi:hypothetical protein
MSKEKKAVAGNQTSQQNSRVVVVSTGETPGADDYEGEEPGPATV